MVQNCYIGESKYLPKRHNIGKHLLIEGPIPTMGFSMETTRIPHQNPRAFRTKIHMKRIFNGNLHGSLYGMDFAICDAENLHADSVLVICHLFYVVSIWNR